MKMSKQHQMNYKRFIATLKQSPSLLHQLTKKFNHVDGLDVAKDVWTTLRKAKVEMFEG
jgi:hypothetical protein